MVTNGSDRGQRRRLAASALAGSFSIVVTSERAGFTKPDPQIFRVAARAAGGTLTGAWMIGDAAESDIAGAAAAAIDSVWLSRGREYPAGYARPTLIADSFPQAVDLVLDNSLT